jgi:hypothetical protein
MLKYLFILWLQITGLAPNQPNTRPASESISLAEELMRKIDRFAVPWFAFVVLPNNAVKNVGKTWFFFVENA